MLIEGMDSLEAQLAQEGYSAKAVLNEHGVVFFSAQLQHRDQKAANISYEDNYAGNALAAMIAPGRMEIRFHQGFTDVRVSRIVAALLAEPRLAFMRSWKFTYQGRLVR